MMISFHACPILLTKERKKKRVRAQSIDLFDDATDFKAVNTKASDITFPGLVYLGLTSFRHFTYFSLTVPGTARDG